jgi:hypothetical protein
MGTTIDEFYVSVQSRWKGERHGIAFVLSRKQLRRLETWCRKQRQGE